MLKKIISLFIILSLSIFNIIGYVYDNLALSYDLNSSSIYTKIVKVSSDDYKIINTLKKKYNFSDGSNINLYIKWLKISKYQIDFKTNNKWIATDNTTNIIKKDLAPKKAYVLTSSISKFNNIKEKSIDNTNIVYTFYSNIIKEETSSYNIVLNKDFTLFENTRWPPVFYISNLDIT